MSLPFGLLILILLPEEHGKRKPEAGQEGASFKIIAELEDLRGRGGVVDVDLARSRIDDPNLANFGAEVILDLLIHLVRRVGRTDDFDREIRNDFPCLGSRYTAS